MKILKDEIRERIQSVAAEEFLLKGFQGASMREVAKKAGINVGNIYHYFENKQALFADIVEPAHCRLRNLIEQTIDHEGEPVVSDSDFGGKMTERLLEFARAYREPFILLFEKSGGTPYENTKDELVRVMGNHIVHESQENPDGMEFFIEVVLRNLLEGFLRIVQNSTEETWVRANISRLIRYHIEGLKLFY